MAAEATSGPVCRPPAGSQTVVRNLYMLIDPSMLNVELP
jgi:hypothetical protein